MNETIRMQISAFVDDELPENEAELLLRRMGQDPELRAQVARYLEIGRIMRGESATRGMDRLRERVLAELDDRALEPMAEEATVAARRNWRPLAGAAVAAAVAVVAIIGLRQTGVETPSSDQLIAEEVVETVEAESYTVPPQDDMVRQYLMSHGEEASALGANGINVRWVSLDFSEDVDVDKPVDTEETQDE